LRVFWYACSGAGISSASLLIYLAALAAKGTDTVILSELNTQMLGYLLLGGFMGGASIVYDGDRLSLMAQTALHVSVTAAAFCVTGLLLGWFGPGKLFGPIAVFLLIYGAIWTSIYLRNRMLARQLNRYGK